MEIIFNVCVYKHQQVSHFNLFDTELMKQEKEYHGHFVRKMTQCTWLRFTKIKIHLFSSLLGNKGNKVIYVSIQNNPYVLYTNNILQYTLTCLQ